MDEIHKWLILPEILVLPVNLDYIFDIIWGGQWLGLQLVLTQLKITRRIQIKLQLTGKFRLIFKL